MIKSLSSVSDQSLPDRPDACAALPL